MHENVTASILKGQIRHFYVNIPAGTLMSHSVVFSSPSPPTADLHVFVAVGAPASAAFCARSCRRVGNGVAMTVQGEDHPSCLHVTVQFKNYSSAFLQHECVMFQTTAAALTLHFTPGVRYAFHVSQNMTGGGDHVLPALQPTAHATGAFTVLKLYTFHLSYFCIEQPV